MPNKTKHRNRRNIKKSTRRKVNKKNIKNIKSIFRKSKNHGGRYINSGTYGDVYGEPRLLCKDEDLNILNDENSAPYNEVSKIFSNKHHAADEYNSVTHLRTIMNEDDLVELQKYCVLPIKECIVKEDISAKDPYASVTWRKNKKNKYNPKILNDKIRNLNGYQNMITYRQGGDNLYEIFNKISNEEDCIDCLTNLLSILKGIQILQKYNIIHGDLKTPNCIEIDNTFKIIDMADVKEIKPSKTSNELPTAFGYYTWPFVSVYTLFFDEEKMKIYNPEQKFKIDQPLLQRLYQHQRDFNTHNYSNEMNSQLRNCFRDINIGFNEDDLQKIRNIGNELIKQKTFGIIDSVEKEYNAEYDAVTIYKNIYGRDNSKTETIRELLEKFNTIFSSFDSEEEMKLDLFKRIDIYSFGIMVLYVIKKYIVCLSVLKPIHSDKLDYIHDLYHIVYACCNQSERVVNIDDLVVGYTAVLQFIYNVQKRIAEENNILTIFGELPYHE